MVRVCVKTENGEPVMCERLDCYLEKFSSLRTDKNRNRWTEQTAFCAPHKPFLILSILDLIASGSISRNFIEPSFELAETFSNYWAQVMPIGTSGSMSYPFYHLASSRFWHLVSQPGTQHQKGLTISSVKRLRELYLGAKFDDDLFPLLVMETSREKIRSTLIETYFSKSTRNILTEQTKINIESSSYSTQLVTTAEPKLVYAYTGNTSPDHEKKVRAHGFRKAIVKLYEHRCALCGIRMLTPEGHTVVEAAHIVPWSKSHNDSPINGMALCRLCHWSFDEGLMGVGKDYDVLISSAVRQDKNFPGHMLTLSGRTIFKPQKTTFWPDQKNLKWHRKEKFKR